MNMDEIGIWLSIIFILLTAVSGVLSMLLKKGSIPLIVVSLVFYSAFLITCLYYGDDYSRMIFGSLAALVCILIAWTVSGRKKNEL